MIQRGTESFYVKLSDERPTISVSFYIEGKEKEEPRVTPEGDGGIRLFCLMNEEVD